MQVVCDAECDDLLPFATKIWCVSVLETATGNIKTYTEREEFVRDSEAWTEIITFNGLGYDHWILWLIWNLSFSVGPDMFNGRPVKLTDALVLSRYLNPDRFGQKHALEVWGEHLGVPKGSHTDFTQLSDEMISYNRQDCLVTFAVYKQLMKELQGDIH